MSNVYKRAGVDVEKGYEAVKRMKKHVEKTKRPEVIGGIGAFAGLFDLSSLPYKEPVLVSGTDGVGTKLMLAFEMNRHDTIGIDLVAMCVNDIIAQGAKPLFFLDYIGCGKNDPAVIEQIVAGVSEGCVQSGAALIGGETAEMPGMYKEDEYDLAGFAVGIVEKEEIITGERITPGNVIVGLASSGIHSNGYSLVRKIIEGYDLNKVYEGLSEPLGDAVLRPTKIYAKAVGSVVDQMDILGIVHVTGGGFYENFPRILPKGLGVEIDSSTWEVPEILSFIQKEGDIAKEEMYGIFNMGIGMALIVEEEVAPTLVEELTSLGETAKIIGKVIDKEGVQIK